MNKLLKRILCIFHRGEKPEPVGMYEIYMINPSSKYLKYKYLGYSYMTERLHISYTPEMFEKVYTGPIYPDGVYGVNNIKVLLENIFYELNVNPPKDYKYPSLSVGDVVNVTLNGDPYDKAYLVDGVGFVRLENFWDEY